MKIYYRISNNSYKKNRLSFATKEFCLNNFLNQFNINENNITIIADNVTEEGLLSFINSKKSNNITIEYTKLNNAQSFKYIISKSCDECNDEDYIYYAEDDYLHWHNSDNLIKEGLQISNYVTLYDHPDKYIDKSDGGNPFIDGGGEITRLVKTNNIHWKLTNSTTLTFGTTGRTIKKDKDIWYKYLQNPYPRDFDAFCDLIQNNGRSLISCVPGNSTHTEIPWICPFKDWNNI